MAATARSGYFNGLQMIRAIAEAAARSASSVRALVLANYQLHSLFRLLVSYVPLARVFNSSRAEELAIRAYQLSMDMNVD